ncbi:UDP-N-acetylmuramoyl-L-alanine--D-glutamate ligase [Campylobacter troglodytis]|uniref:UDP-N-acetylmuramoyl-L-alanine--D-glutamate ligase n=1 Tax=Campylobacter troglodytis TaxID=654363 RepID=UPI0011578841|nr:UDP-N-acetylmuramoyl-L-alanine--D-glutamate ligase [Campylobacter troglodytis]TQR54015.1 UDP-N-acetylmuramoyl-L-alanine--D-glutamate ligase [Campylobacter troglodytis]
MSKKISLFGYGKTTKALAKLAKQFGSFKIYDDAFAGSGKDELGNLLLNPSEFKPKKSKLEIASPGFPPQHKLIKKARNLISEYDFFYDAMPKSVWISGTNGKTTTTQMTQHLLSKFNSQMGGNVGVPLAELDPNARLWVLETSSFTLHYTKRAKPEIYALLPISADHISWHEGFKRYEEAKLSLLPRLKEGDVAILPELQAKKKIAKKCKALIISYKDEFDLAKKMSLDLDKIAFKTPFLMDAILALSIQKILFKKADYEGLNSFKLEEHKLEELFDSKNRLWVNDTKATNIDAVLAALKRYEDKKIHLILGGDDKGVSLEPLFKSLCKLNVELYAIGKSAFKILELSRLYKIKARNCEFLKKAIRLIDQSLKKEEVALLSPACASLDQFKSYAQRGELFKALVRKL